MCNFIWEWIYAKQISPETQGGHLGGFRGGGGQQFKNIGKLSDWHQVWFTSADSSGNGHRLIAPQCRTIPHVGIGGGGGLVGQQFKSLGNVVKRLGRSGLNVAPIMQVHLGMDTG